MNSSLPDALTGDETANIKMQMTMRLCNFVTQICSDNSVTIIKDNNEFNSCQDKIRYCRLAIDQINEAKGTL